MLRLLQICNVGDIVGGTAACAWSVVNALPDCEHVVVFRSAPTSETCARFSECTGMDRIVQRRRLTRSDVKSLQPDLVLMHNIGQDLVAIPPELPAIQYVHSKIQPAKADLELHCSRWLAGVRRKREASVCWQGVPLAGDQNVDRGRSEQLTIGRICTPTSRKWPPSLIPFYRELAEECPGVEWEFVGCPHELQSSLAVACRGRARFHEAAWVARRHLARWDALLYRHPDLTESFGRTVAEAMRVGTIPIVDDRGGFVEQVNRDVGFLCRHAEEFKQAIIRLREPVPRGEMSRAANHWANKWFSLTAFRRRLLTWFERL